MVLSGAEGSWPDSAHERQKQVGFDNVGLFNSFGGGGYVTVHHAPMTEHWQGLTSKWHLRKGQWGWQYKMTTQVIVPLPQHRRDNHSAGFETRLLYAVLQTRSQPRLLWEYAAMCHVRCSQGITKVIFLEYEFSLNNLHLEHIEG